MRVRYSADALADLERLCTFLLEAGHPEPEDAIREITGAIRMLERHPYIGRGLRRGMRMLVIAFGRAGYVASYRVTEGGVEILRIRHQREAGTKL